MEAVSLYIAGGKKSSIVYLRQIARQQWRLWRGKTLPAKY